MPKDHFRIAWETITIRFLEYFFIWIVFSSGLYGQCVTGTVISTDVSCAGANDGTIVIVDAEGETGTFEYSIDGGRTWQMHNTFTGLSPGIYNVQLRDLIKPACIYTLDPARVISEPGPLDPGVINTDAVESCVNYMPEALTFIIPPSGGRTPYSYQWYLNGEPVEGETGNIYYLPVLSAPGIYTYYCIVTDICHVSSATGYKTFTVVEDIGITIAGNGIFCQNEPVTLSAEIPGITGTVSWQWQVSTDSNNWTNIEGAVNSYYEPSTAIPGEFFYRINVIIDGAVCNDTASLIVNPLPTASLSGSANACLNSSDPVIILTGSNGYPPYTFTYRVNDGPAQVISGDSLNQAILTVPTSSVRDYSYTLLTVTDANSCSQALNDTVIVSVRGLPTAEIESAGDVLCFGDSTGTATATATGATEPYTFIWDTSPPQDGATAMRLPAGEYVVRVTDANGCEDSTKITINQPLEPLEARIISSTDVLCIGDETGTAAVSASGGTGPYTYRWSTTPVQTTSTASGLTNGIYFAVVADANGCVDTAAFSIGSVMDYCLIIPEAFSPNGDGINDYWEIEDLAFYPDAVITMYDRWNKVVWVSERGCPCHWDGKINNVPLPVDSYHYLIELGNNIKPILGHVTIVR